MEVKISREATIELEEAAKWYEKEQTGLGKKLINEFEHTVQLLREPNPPLTPVIGNASKLGARKLILYRFPFSLITIQHKQKITIVAFAHHARRPGYWEKRIT